MAPLSIGSYRVLRAIGSGGMGTVYEAVDTRLDRKVAIKGLAAGDEGPARRERLRREARVAASLSHPAITRVFEVITEDDRDWVVMELVSGRTLADVVAEGPLPSGEVCRIGEEVASALAEAHGRGLIHRDVKTENVMITPEGRVKVLDFGLARHVEPSEEFAEGLTGEGTVVGTARSMSPEQARGKQLDARSDVFSLGSLLYEAATGTSAFSGATNMDTMLNVARGSFVPPSRVNPTVSPELEGVITRCLEVDPAQRFPSAAAVSGALSGIRTSATSLVPAAGSLTGAVGVVRRRPWRSALAAVAVLGALAGSLYLSREHSVPTRVVAILPIEVRPTAAAEESVSAVVDNAISLYLARNPRLIVVSANDVKAELKAGGELPGLARRLGADELVRGRLDLGPRKGEASLELARIDGATGKSVWWQRDVIGISDPLLISDRVAGLLEDAYGGTAVSEGPRPAGVSPEAFRLYLGARAALRARQGASDVAGEIADLERARLESPQYVPILTDLADLYGGRNGNDGADLARSRELFDEAARLAPNDPKVVQHQVDEARREGRRDDALAKAEALVQASPGRPFSWVTLGLVRRWRGEDTEAEGAFQRAVALKPDWLSWYHLANVRLDLGDADGTRQALTELLDRAPDNVYGLQLLSLLEMFRGDYAAAREVIEEKILPRRRSRSNLLNLGVSCFYLGDLDRAEALLRETLEREPSDPFVWVSLAYVLQTRGETAAARVEFERAIADAEKQLPTTRVPREVLSQRAIALAFVGRSQDAVRAVEDLVSRYPRNRETLFYAAAVHALSGDRTSALVWAERALEAGAPKIWFTGGPEFASMRDDPDLVELLGRLSKP